MKNILLINLLLFILVSCKKNSNGSVTVVPIAPSELTGTVMITSHQINLEWKDNSTNEAGFKIERKVAGGAFAAIANQIADITKHSDPSLNPNTTYIYRVYSHNSAGNSPSYSNELTISTGSQIWMDKNLNVTTYRNGDPIPQVTDQTLWTNLTTGAWCYYNNDPSNEAIYGKLYNWYAVNDTRGLAPVGWHIPSETEWNVMLIFLGGNTVAGGKLKSVTGWQSPNTGTTNSSGFSALPSGQRRTIFSDLSFIGYWWSSTLYTAPITARYFALTNGGAINSNNDSRYYGFSVRCVKD